jgi:hypothetical protein
MFRLIKYFLALAPFAILFLSLFSDQIGQYIFNRYAIRWYPMRAEEERVQSIAVHNEGYVSLPKIRVELDFPADLSKPLKDYDFASFDSEPRSSFLEALAHSDSMAHLDKLGMDVLAPVIDEQSKTHTLYDFNDALSRVPLSSLRAETGKTSYLDNYLKSGGALEGFRDEWLKKCGGDKAPDPTCKQMSVELASWEYSKSEMGEAACKRWREEAGVEVNPHNNLLAPNGRIYFTFPLEVGQSGFLRLRFGPNSIKAVPYAVTTNSAWNAIQVDSFDDLHASPFYILFKYDALARTVILVLIIIYLFFVYNYARPKALLKVHEVFNQAIATDEHEFWETASQWYGFTIRQTFKDLRHQAHKENIQASSEELFDYLRNQLHADYGQKRFKFKDEQQLKNYISQQLTVLVNNS